MPSLRVFPLEQGRPALELESRVQIEGKMPSLRVFSLERGRPALDGVVRFGFEGVNLRFVMPSLLQIAIGQGGSLWV